MKKQLLATLLCLSLCGGGGALALDTPATPQPANDAGEETGRRIAANAAAAIQALGASATAKQISAIIFKAVRSSPGNVLQIVAATVRVSPSSAATEIVVAATAAVPNPWKKVIYRKLSELEASGSRPAGTPAPDGGRKIDPGANGIPMTLAEAILRTAFDAKAGLSFAELQDAMNATLRMDPAALILS